MMKKYVYVAMLLMLAGLSAARAGNLPVIYITTADSSAITSRDVWKENTVIRLTWNRPRRSGLITGQHILGQ